VTARKGRHYSVRQWLATVSLGFGRFSGVLGERSVAEADRQHVAPRPRRIAGPSLGLAPLGWGRENMLEAGPLVMSQGNQWRPTRSAAGESRTKTVGLVGGRRLELVKARSWWSASEQALALAEGPRMLGKEAGCDRRRQRFGSPRSWRAENAHTVVWTGHRSSHAGW